MTLTERVQKEMIEAMRGKQELRLSTLRMMKAALHNREVDKRGALDEKEELQVLSTMIKQRKDSLEIYEKQQREDLASKEREEIEIIERFLPKQMGADELKTRLSALIAELGASSPADIGKVMGAATKQLAGQADGKTISGLVKELLSK